MIGTTVPALKEWASAIKALETGRQIMVMRKGGIVEETRRFELKSPAFYLYPTYEHQRKELIKSSDHFYVEESLADWVPEASTIRLTAYAEVTQDLEIRDQEMLDRLLDFHMWTADFAEDRLKWKRKDPLHVLILRVYRLKEPMEIPVLPEYNGCRSWISIPNGSVPCEMTPVVDVADFDEQVQKINETLKM
ncbi:MULTISPECIES: DUF1802 family protein [Paenibacillus]|uniref:DUF1802 family protein n=1 Tax=Paenibacillus pabuli TaxID=1472 RepID=A0A855XYN8_9BACL|nr:MULTISPECIES: DUF1802 family protein [Paenibacillus]PWW41034.1 hypothetical protein DET56_105310 [Paenibacillus pabuli]PXW12158.1 hypothetical protein DEU73_1011033 [Paenibacillus taichungensis]QLG41727.1 DUF1802 family protein [Paenibacillus sp. E222]RAI97126.1 hypothetical protein DET54_10586 [Paenibacillus pabuli]SEN09820.1 hypothetical protein SAMN05518670_1058 [Paenibacillus sp. OK076]